MAENSRRLWCSCVLIDFLAGTERAKAECPRIIQEAERGRTQIVVSALALAEVARIDAGLPAEEVERRIKEFSRRHYIIVANVDTAVGEIARRLVRAYPLKPLDAVHLATAIFYQIPLLETFDGDLLKLDGKEHLRDMPAAAPLTIALPQALPPLPLFPTGT